ncbi:MAG: TetR/AcrR family transcriptional regulator, partial [Dermatophilaceae bacterium]
MPTRSGPGSAATAASAPTGTAQPRARRLEPDARREQILACAVQLFGERPYAAVSTTDLAAAAGVTRGLLHHYFGTKRDLYLEVVREMLFLPGIGEAVTATGPLLARVERSVDWFLDTIGAHGATFVAVSGAEGVGGDPEIEAMLAEADDLAARNVLEIVGVTSATAASAASCAERAVVRAYASLVKGAVREWVRARTLTRDDVRLLMVQTLVAIVEDVMPQLSTPVKAVLWDADGVLQHTPPGWQERLVELGGPEFPDAVMAAEQGPLVGQGTFREALEALVTEGGLAASDQPVDIDAVLDLWRTVQIDPEALALVDAVRAGGTPCYLA